MKRFLRTQPSAPAAQMILYQHLHSRGRLCHTIFAVSKNTKGPINSDGAFWILMRRRPTLPHTFAYSTIGPAGLNFRVRDGNGWNPRGKITANLALRDPSRFALR